MNLTTLSNERRASGPRAAAAGLMASLALSALLGTSAQAEEMYRQDPPIQGGVSMKSKITSITQSGTNVTLTWYGPQGTYFIEAAPLTSPSSFTRVGQTISSDFVGSYTIPGGATNSQVFRVVNYNGFVGTGGCQGCHGDKYAEYANTHHATAYDTIAAFGNSSCFPCHSVGNNQVTGFLDPVSTPWLKHVGCESCHGPGGAHKYGDHDIVHPAVSIDPAICGGCHTDAHHPTYDEYMESLHSQVNDDVAYGFANGVYYPNTIVLSGQTLYGYYVTTNSNGTLKTNATTGIVHSSYAPGAAYDPGNDRQMGCGACHSGATRMAMLKDWEARQQGNIGPLALPAAHDSAAWGPTCANCHDPHSDANPVQLRNPLASTNYFTLPTTSDKRTVYSWDANGNMLTNYVYYNTAFATYYDENIQVCAQCHNSRGARWDGRSYGLVTNASGVTVALTTNVSFSRPPHHSPQYNVLIGIVQNDYFTTNSSGVATNWLHRHGTSVSSSTGTWNTNGCAQCHMYPETPEVINEANPAYTGHRFEVSFGGCTVSGCHGSVPLYEETQLSITNDITRVADLLRQWAVTKGTALGLTKGGNNFDFTTTGALAPTPNTSNAGPSASDQVKIPNAIKQARFNAYMVLHDGSLGVHNPSYAEALLTDAENKVLNEFTLANFKAYTASGFTPFSVGFTNMGTGVTGYNWKFGDGNTSTLASPTNIYTVPGVYGVTLTATGASGSETLTRTNYITVSTKPVVTFTATPNTGKSPLTVSFANTSTSTDSVTMWRWRISGPGLAQQTIYANNTSFTFTNTFTTNVSYSVTLRAYTPSGTVQTTSNNVVTVTP